jgi:hypothetical protein
MALYQIIAPSPDGEGDLNALMIAGDPLHALKMWRDMYAHVIGSEDSIMSDDFTKLEDGTFIFADHNLIEGEPEHPDACEFVIYEIDTLWAHPGVVVLGGPSAPYVGYCWDPRNLDHSGDTSA